MCEMNSVFEIPPIGKLPLNPTPACQRALQPRETLYLQIVYLEGNILYQDLRLNEAALHLLG